MADNIYCVYDLNNNGTHIARDENQSKMPPKYNNDKLRGCKQVSEVNKLCDETHQP